MVSMIVMEAARVKRLDQPGKTRYGSKALDSLKRVVDLEPKNHLAKSYYGVALLDEAQTSIQISKDARNTTRPKGQQGLRLQQGLKRSLSHLDDARDMQEACGADCATFLLDTQVRCCRRGFERLCPPSHMPLPMRPPPSLLLRASACGCRECVGPPFSCLGLVRCRECVDVRAPESDIQHLLSTVKVAPAIYYLLVLSYVLTRCSPPSNMCTQSPLLSCNFFTYRSPAAKSSFCVTV